MLAAVLTAVDAGLGRFEKPFANFATTASHGAAPLCVRFGVRLQSMIAIAIVQGSVIGSSANVSWRTTSWASIESMRPRNSARAASFFALVPREPYSSLSLEDRSVCPGLGEELDCLELAPAFGSLAERPGVRVGLQLVKAPRIGQELHVGELGVDGVCSSRHRSEGRGVHREERFGLRGMVLEQARGHLRHVVSQLETRDVEMDRLDNPRGRQMKRFRAADEHLPLDDPLKRRRPDLRGGMCVHKTVEIGAGLAEDGLRLGEYRIEPGGGPVGRCDVGAQPPDHVGLVIEGGDPENGAEQYRTVRGQDRKPHRLGPALATGQHLDDPRQGLVPAPRRSSDSSRP